MSMEDGFPRVGGLPHYRGCPPMGQGTEPFQSMLNANNLPTAEFADYTFVFH